MRTRLAAGDSASWVLLVDGVERKRGVRVEEWTCVGAAGVTIESGWYLVPRGGVLLPPARAHQAGVP